MFISFCVSKKNKDQINFAEEFGNLFGLIFQITDDILDQEKDFNYLGKTPGKDIKQGKSTLLSNYSKKKLRYFCKKKFYEFKLKNIDYINQNPILEVLLNFYINKII